MSHRVLSFVAAVLAWGCAAAPRLPEAAEPMVGAQAPVPRPQVERDVGSYLASMAGPFTATYPADPKGGDMGPVRVEGKRYHDDEPVGPYNQPGWTTHRRFATTRAYVLPQGQIEMEAWWRGTWPDDSGPKNRIQGELGVGLPHRFQLDIYQNFEDPAGGEIEWGGTAVELRWALADWDEIFWNPTLYGEWKFVAEGPDVYELKLLMADDIAPRWRGAVNAIYEAQDSGAEETEIAISAAASYTVFDDKFYVGVETKVNRVTEDGPGGPPNLEVLLGPSFQWRPTANTHVDIVPLFGLTDDSPIAQVFVVLGIDFGPKDEHGFSPTSLKSE